MLQVLQLLISSRHPATKGIELESRYRGEIFFRVLATLTQHCSLEMMSLAGISPVALADTIFPATLGLSPVTYMI